MGRTGKTSDIPFLLDDLALSGQIFRTCIPDLYDLYDMYDLAHVAGWELQNLQYLGHLSWVGSVRCRSCTIPHSGSLTCVVDDLDDLCDLYIIYQSDVWNRYIRFHALLRSVRTYW